MQDVYNGEWTLPAYTAMCLWEEFITAEEGTYPHFDNMRVNHGSHATRDAFLMLVPICDTAWIVAAAHGYDEAFDWDFVPQFLILWSANQRATGEEIGKAIVEGWSYAEAQRKARKQ